MVVDVVPEHMFVDEAKLVSDILKNSWSLGADDMPNITCEVEQFFLNSRVGSVYVYMTSHNSEPASVDYSTLHKVARVSIKLSTRYRAKHIVWANEIERILMGVRRIGQEGLQMYTHLQLLTDRWDTSDTGFYSTTFEIKLEAFHWPVNSAGFGDTINKEIYDTNNS